MVIRRIAGLTWNLLLMRVDNSTEVVDRMYMKHVFASPLRVKTQLSLEERQRPSCWCCTALCRFWGLVSSQYLISMWWRSRWKMLRSLGRCCLKKVDLLVAAGSAANILSICPLPLWRIHSPPMPVCCFFVSVEMEAISTASALR